MTEKQNNPMKAVRIEKVTVNMGVGQPGDELKRAQTIMELITGTKSVQTLCKVKQPTWGIREGLPIGVKVTLRKKKAEEFLRKALKAKDNALNAKNFDVRGNFGFGIREHIDLQGVKYDPKLGIRGFDVLVTLERRGYRIKKRKTKKQIMSKHHWIKKDDAMDFVKQNFGVEISG